ncbi:uncharacterized protein TNCV_2787951 [Trichonephila clavipes]|uniref:Uncharacterized protein n=1 Tax=Trichonephila clavipes TaxID=2585209 RepID=A0A8X6SYI4_TRICX|nr:uncharacterized protein TNCV_2787951 [Trichonephila clavipes]
MRSKAAQMTEVMQVCILKCFCEQRYLVPNGYISDLGFLGKSESLRCPQPPLKGCTKDPGIPCMHKRVITEKQCLKIPTIIYSPYRTFEVNDEAHFWLNGYVNKQNCRIWSEADPQVYVETPLHPEKTDCLVRFMGWWNPSSKMMKATTLQPMVIGIEP